MRENGRTDTATPPPSDEEPELQNLVSARSNRTDRPASAPGPKVTTPSVRIEEDPNARKSSSSLKVNIPQVGQLNIQFFKNKLNLYYP